MADKKSGRIVGRSHSGARTSLLKSRKTRRAEQAIARRDAQRTTSQAQFAMAPGASATGSKTGGAFPLPSEWRAKRVRGLQPSALRSRTALCGTLATLSVFAAAQMFGATPAGANPEGGQVVAGSAEIVQTTPDRLDIIQSSNQAIINWESFSIGLGEHTHFQQPSASAIALNRVVGVDPSAILGRLSATGHVMLINPNGILFGANSQIDVAGLVATTANIADSDFMAGRYNFDQASLMGTASIINQGTITIADGGLAALVAPGVVNDGIIQARLGHVVLAAGNTFTVDFYGDGLVNLAVQDAVAELVTGVDGSTLDALVTNSGTIQADGGSVLLTVNTASDIVDQVISMNGVIEARTAYESNGEIVLMGGSDGIVSVAGTLDASGDDAGEAGGTVKVLGNLVGLFEGAEVDVSGPAGGGTALIGGNFQGGGEEQNAARTFVGEGASINADATVDGDGGLVIVWSDEVTRFQGDISARGGAAGGDGGFAEVSGKKNLGFQGSVDLTAAEGETGTLLLDPTDINIVSAGYDTGSSLASVDAFADPDLNSDGDGYANEIDVTLINDASANVTLQANNDINVDASINISTSGITLTMDAGDDININNDITTTNAAVSITANDAGGSESTGGSLGVITMLDGTTINAGNATITLSAEGDIAVETLTTSGSVYVTSTAGSIDADANIASSAGSVDIDAAGTFDIAAGARVTAGGAGTTLTIDAAGITINNGSTGTETVANTGSGTITLTNIGNTDINLGKFAISGADGAVKLKANAGTSGSILEIDDTDTYADIVTTGSATVFLYADTAVGVSSAKPLDTDMGTMAFLMSGDLFVKDADNLTVSGVSQAGEISIESATGSLTLGQMNSTVAGSGITLHGEPGLHHT